MRWADTGGGRSASCRRQPHRRGRHRGAITARVEADVEEGNELKRKAVTVDTASRSNLADVTGRDLYKDLTVVAINAAQGQESISCR
ncbi:hypothetical protein [Streptomyces sp. NPDC056817]|uniref:hypothetical protein n=1 Tax=Streptomyces sp. NPDC056817 TaxID=3345950 RepID=UPI0036C266E3